MMPYKKGLLPLWGGFLSALGSNHKGNKRGFTLTEILIALGVIAVIAVLIIPVITTRAQNKSFALSYETEVKQMLNSLEGLPVNENKDDIAGTMMYVESDSGNYANNSGAYINKYMKVVKYCGNEPGDCFGANYYEYKDNDRVEFNISDIKGACALLKNGVSICLKPQIKSSGGNDEIQGWIDLNGPKGPNIYGRDLRTFAINLKQRAVFTEEEPTRVYVPDPPPPCEGENCGEVEKDPCKINPRGEECCKRDGFVASGKDDICCPWYRDPSTGANHLVCYPGTAGCDPTVDPNCKVNECENHSITGPSDECCPILESQGKHDPNCCAPSDTSDYCCSVHPETEGCCKKNIDSGKLTLSAGSNCCKYPAIYQSYSGCKPACEQDNNSEQCCNTVARRNEINNPDDACCMYEAINGIDSQGENNAYNKYCCRLSKNASEQCCKWKYDHIGSSLDYYASHDYTQNDGTFDGCCHGNVRGIKYAKGKSDSKSIEVLKRCCTLNNKQSDSDEDEACCDYLVGQLGDAKLMHGQALRRCCKYSKHKNKAQCCSHETDGMASQTYNANVSWAAQCCMPNSLYNNNVTPHIQCCFVNNGIAGESNAFWNDKRWDGCCSYGDNTYNGHKANTESQWQKNCCRLSRSKYPSDAAYNSACCLSNATAKTANRDSWQYFSVTKNECCETLDNQYGANNRNDNWTSHCCYGFKGGNLSTNNPYYETEPKCCNISGNWTEGCCTKSGLDKSDEKWKKNCCSMPTSYTNNVEYRKYCCFDNNTSNSKASSTDNDYTRNSENADNPSSKNAANVNNGSNKQYCCDPDIAENPSVTDNGNKFTWGTSNTPNKSCCDYFAGKEWKDNDGNTLSKYYKAACCQAYGHKDGLNCEELWMCGARYGYGVTPSKLSSEIANGCCVGWALGKANEDVPTSAWKNGCCDNPAYYQSHVTGKNAAYRQFCCQGASSDRQRKGEGNTSNNAQYCCFPDSTNPNTDCCTLFKSKGTADAWKDWDGNTLSANYMTYCCNKSTTSTSYCPDSCAIRWNTSESNASVNYDFSRCCKDRALATNTSPVNTSTAVNRTKAIWKNNCCAYAPVGKAGNNSQAYASYADYRSGCCNSSSDQSFKSGNGGASQDSVNCCIPNQTTVNTSNGAISGITPTKACCDAFKAYDTAKTGAWKSHDGETINDAYKTACCKLHGVCPDGGDSCKIRSYTWDSSKYNLPTCCKDSTMQSQHYTDSDKVWRSSCCDGSITAGTSSLNTLGLTDYRNYCCYSAGSSEATLKSGNEDYRCCTNASENTRLVSAKCCDAASNGGWTSAYGGTTFRSSCCGLDSKYCNCSDLTDKSKTNWINKCCVSSNPGGLNSTNFNSACCANANGATKVSGNYNTYCCTGTSPTNENNHYCCVTGNRDSQCVCNNANGKLQNGHYATRCCTGTSPTNENNHYCCVTGNRDSQCVCNNANGKLQNGHYDTRCCTGTSATSENNNYCCVTGNRDAQCTCNNGNGRLTNGHYATRCCTNTTTPTTENSNYCCVTGNVDGMCTCNNGNGKLTNGHYATRCCTNTTTPTTENSSYCCVTGNIDGMCTCNNGNGKLTNGHYATRCCTNTTTPTTENSNYCCVTGNIDGMCTCNNANGKLQNGHYATRCCTGTSATSENSNYCCVTGNRDVQCTCANANGKLTNGHYATRCCTGSSATSENSNYCCVTGNRDVQCTCNNANGKLTNGHYATRCCTGTSATTENNNYCCITADRDSQCTCAARASKTSSHWNLPTCCLDSTMQGKGSDSTWQSSCCTTGNYNSLTTDNKKRCCARMGQSSWSSLFTVGNNCCSVLGADQSTGKASYNGVTYSSCQHACYKSIYSTNYQESDPDTPGSAAYCCKNKLGTVSGGHTTESWQKYCCRTYKLSTRTWNFSPATYYAFCCPYWYSNGIYWYAPFGIGGTCEWGGADSYCSDYLYTARGFYCGSTNACKAWARYSATKPTGGNLTTCCTTLHDASQISLRKSDCCAHDGYRQSAKGQADCCVSEPSDSTLKANCCKEASRSYCPPSTNTNTTADGCIYGSGTNCSCSHTSISLSCSVTWTNWSSNTSTYGASVYCSVSGCPEGYAIALQYTYTDSSYPYYYHTVSKTLGHGGSASWNWMGGTGAPLSLCKVVKKMSSGGYQDIKSGTPNCGGYSCSSGYAPATCSLSYTP